MLYNNLENANVLSSSDLLSGCGRAAASNVENQDGVSEGNVYYKLESTTF